MSKTTDNTKRIQRVQMPEVTERTVPTDNTFVRVAPVEVQAKHKRYKTNKDAEELAYEIVKEANQVNTGKANGRNNTDLPLQTEHPELAVLFAPEFTTYGALGGAARVGLGLAGSHVGSNVLGTVGD